MFSSAHPMTPISMETMENPTQTAQIGDGMKMSETRIIIPAARSVHWMMAGRVSTNWGEELGFILVESIALVYEVCLCDENKMIIIKIVGRRKRFICIDSRPIIVCCTLYLPWRGMHGL